MMENAIPDCDEDNAWFLLQGHCHVRCRSVTDTSGLVVPHKEYMHMIHTWLRDPFNSCQASMQEEPRPSQGLRKRTPKDELGKESKQKKNIKFQKGSFKIQKLHKKLPQLVPEVKA